MLTSWSHVFAMHFVLASYIALHGVGMSIVLERLVYVCVKYAHRPIDRPKGDAHSNCCTLLSIAS